MPTTDTSTASPVGTSQGLRDVLSAYAAGHPAAVLTLDAPRGPDFDGVRIRIDPRRTEAARRLLDGRAAS